MLKSLSICIAVLAGFASVAVAAQTDAECKAAWTKADANNDGVLVGDEAAKFLEAIKKSGKEYDVNGDGKLDRDEFMKACTDGVFASVK